MSEFELVTGPTLSADTHRLWLNRGDRLEARRIYRSVRRLGVDRRRAKLHAVSEMLDRHWFWRVWA